MLTYNLIKVCIIGDGNIGKTMLKNKLLGHKQTSNLDYESLTIFFNGINYRFWFVEYRKWMADFEMRFQWFLSDSQLLILVFNTLKPHSLDFLRNKYLQIKKLYLKTNQELPRFIVVGFAESMQESQKGIETEGEKFAQEIQSPFFVFTGQDPVIEALKNKIVRLISI